MTVCYSPVMDIRTPYQIFFISYVSYKQDELKFGLYVQKQWISSPKAVMFLYAVFLYKPYGS